MTSARETPISEREGRNRSVFTIQFALSADRDTDLRPGKSDLSNEIAFKRLPEIDPAKLVAHMSDPRIAEHMPLLVFEWDLNAATDFVAKKEEYWTRDGLGHWAFLTDGRYVGWGGLQKEGDEWDFGLVLRPDAFGQGQRISRKIIDFAIADKRIPYVTFLLPPSRKKLRGLERLGATRVGRIVYDGSQFLKYRLETS